MYKSLFLIILSHCVLISCISKSTLNKTKIIEEKEFNIYVIDKSEMDFGVSLGKPKNVDFYINSNFFSKKNNSIGLVVINKRRHSKRNSGGGYFYVVNGVPHISTKYCPTMTEFASQSILWGIDNGILNTSLINKNHAKKSVYRTLIGENSKGQIMIISSNRIGFVTIQEILNYGLNNGMIEGILLDGGSSVEYKFSTGLNEIEFNALPNILKPTLGIGNPTAYIYGNFKKK